jgi:Xaa-Pro aminopeptidase
VRTTGAVHVLSVTDVGVPDDVPHANLYPRSWNPATLVGFVAAIPGVATAARVGLDGLTPLWDGLLAAALPEAELVDGEAIMRAARRTKSADEVACIRAASSVADGVLAAALGAVANGEDDRVVTAIAMEAMAADGVTSAAFEPVIMGDNGRVTVAIGVLREGWEADVARTAPGAQRPDRLASAIDRCRPGAVVANLGADVHGVGTGYEVLEPTDVLEAGMALSVGADGARDTLVVTDAGPEVLTGSAP